MRGATAASNDVVDVGHVSIHAPHAGRDPRAARRTQAAFCFNPRAPCGARPFALNYSDKHHEFQSTRPMRGATFSFCCVPLCTLCFNPRAPCGARRKHRCRRTAVRCFNPRAPCGARRYTRSRVLLRWAFQSTRPMRGATASRTSNCCALAEFQSTRPMRGATAVCVCGGNFRMVSIHAPHAGRDILLLFPVVLRYVSIHAPHAGRDLGYTSTVSRVSMFQSTRPMRGATDDTPPRQQRRAVSIHAPHAGRDDRTGILRQSSARFNPRAPCGARPHRSSDSRGRMRFQSTRPMRGATCSRYCCAQERGVSIHAPHAGRDYALRAFASSTTGFNPRAPCGARPAGFSDSG